MARSSAEGAVGEVELLVDELFQPKAGKVRGVLRREDKLTETL